MKQGDEARSTRDNILALTGSVGEAEKSLRVIDEAAANIPETEEKIRTTWERLEKSGITDPSWLTGLSGTAKVFRRDFSDLTDSFGRFIDYGDTRNLKAGGVLAALSGEAQKLGINLKDADKDQREFVAKSFLSQFADEAVRAGNTWEGSLTILRNRYKEFVGLVANSGAYKEIIAVIGVLKDNLKDLFDSGQAKQWAEQVGSAMVSGIKGLSYAIGFFQDTYVVIKTSLMGFKGLVDMVVSGMILRFTEAIDGIVTDVSTLLNKLPLVPDSWKQSLNDLKTKTSEWSDAARTTYNEAVSGPQAANKYYVENTNHLSKISDFLDQVNKKKKENLALDAAHDKARSGKSAVGNPEGGGDGDDALQKLKDQAGKINAQHTLDNIDTIQRLRAQKQAELDILDKAGVDKAATEKFWDAQIAKAQEEEAHSLQQTWMKTHHIQIEMAKQMAVGVTKVFSDWIAGLVTGQKKGTKEMLAATGQMFGGILVQAGQSHIELGIGKMIEGGWPPNPVAITTGLREMAQGAVLISLGTIMGSMASSKSSGSSSGGSSAGAAIASAGAAAASEKKGYTHLVINVSDDALLTGRQMKKIINDAQNEAVGDNFYAEAG